jgi:O-acetyl-ADP-ribose deacetylase (regulator of RNase III)
LSKVNLEVALADITTLKVDVVVNAAKSSLRGGGGVDGAIHAAAGPKLLEYLGRFTTCDTGDVRVSPGFDLPAKHIVHAVGPIWRGGNAEEEKNLRSCYLKSIEQAALLGAKSIAFSAISTGVYGYPKRAAATTAVNAVREGLKRHSTDLERVVFVAFEVDDYGLLSEALNENE